ncbi:MAG: coproporphyrinogen III oxidase family protein [Kiritimatiellae bacterium]|nr:coproporphyrinogen III oxidase family protein [Kiritimatiellia bacterium]
MNLYVHFPFCRSKCAYCALRSRAGSKPEARAAYAEALARRVRAERAAGRVWDAVYFGGGSPALCDLSAFAGCGLETAREFTVELHPLDATDAKLDELAALGVNRVSMGVQSFDDAVLARMGRGHSAADALAAWRRIRAHGFANAGVDLIAGWPAADGVWRRTVETACSLEPAHVSCYTLIREPGTRVDLWTRKGIFAPPDDDAALAELDFAFDAFGKLGLRRYEISNCARPGAECRHNLGTWRGEDYLGLGEGAHGRLGLARTENGATVDVLTPERDAVERAIFAFRMREGLDLDAAAKRFPALAPRLSEWRAALARLAAEGLVAAEGARWRLTRRGTEVCDAVLADLV